MERRERFGYVVLTGRPKILDYGNQQGGQQIATADTEDGARLICNWLNQHTTLVEQRDRLLAVLRDIHNAFETGVDARSRWAHKVRAIIREVDTAAAQSHEEQAKSGSGGEG